MRILSIETSCDETGISLLNIQKQGGDTHVEFVANELATQASEHEAYGGVYPTLAKRLHAQNFPALLSQIVTDVTTRPANLDAAKKGQVRSWLHRHPEYADNLLELIESHGVPAVNAIAVTVGPGLEPALWVGINTAKSLAIAADIPIIPTNHMAGHLISARVPENYNNEFTLQEPNLPAVGLLVSGGHTEIIHQSADGELEKIGQTRDDAAGEAFDKVGRALGLPYPAGPQISKFADQIRNSKFEIRNSFALPRPMIEQNNLDFSFSGLKTAAVRLIEEHKPLEQETKAIIAYELETAITEVLISKTTRAIDKTNADTLLAGGGVTANTKLRNELTRIANERGIATRICPLSLATDNAIMIGLAGYEKQTDETQEVRLDPDQFDELTADSRLSL